MNLKDLPISGGSKIKLVNKRCIELWKGYMVDMLSEFLNKEVVSLQPELESYNREILVIKLDIE